VYGRLRRRHGLPLLRACRWYVRALCGPTGSEWVEDGRKWPKWPFLAKKGVQKSGQKSGQKCPLEWRFSGFCAVAANPERGVYGLGYLALLSLSEGTTFGHFGQKWYPPKKVFLGCEKTWFLVIFGDFGWFMVICMYIHGKSIYHVYWWFWRVSQLGWSWRVSPAGMVQDGHLDRSGVLSIDDPGYRWSWVSMILGIDDPGYRW